MQIGLLPIATTRVLITNYQPLRAYLEQTLKRPVELVTAHDFSSFHQHTLAGDYDLIVTAAHLGRIAEIEANYLPLVRYTAAHRTLLITARDQPLKSVQDLRGKVVAGIDPLALAVNETELWLKKQGLQAGTDYTLLQTPTPVSAAYSLQNHQSAMAISSPQGMKQMPDSLRASIDVFATLPALPSLMWLAHPRLKDDLPKLKAALLAFSSASKEGAEFYNATGYIGMKTVTSEETRAVDELAAEANKRIHRQKISPVQNSKMPDK